MKEHVAERVTDQARQQTCVDHLIAFGGDDALSAVDIPWSRRYAKDRRDGKIGGGKRRKEKAAVNSTIRRELNVLVAATNHARRWKRFAGMVSVERPPDEADHTTGAEMPYFEKDVLADIFRAAEEETLVCRAKLDEEIGGDRESETRLNYLYALELDHWIKLAYYTGSRGAAVARLHAEQVNLTGRTINLQRPGQRRTVKRRGIVPIFDEVLPVIAVRVGMHPKGPLFRTVKFYRPFMRLCEDLELPEPHHPHMLRHSRATHLLQDGKDIWDVAKLLCDTVKTVEANYGHHSPRELMRKLQ